MNPVDIDDLLSLHVSKASASSVEFPAFVAEDRKYLYKDALSFSGHKFLGGPGCPGVLIVKKDILLPTSVAPTIPGGGTVFYVTDNHHRYLSNREEREEAGTPNIVGDIRLGLAMNLKQHTNNLLKQCAANTTDSLPSSMEQLELDVSFRMQKKLEAIPNLVLLGRIPLKETDKMSSESVRYRGRHLPIFSFLVKHQFPEYNAQKKILFLHYNFVCSLLNDLFGIQARGGCQCAGPFSQQLLGLVSGHKSRMEVKDGNLLNDLYEISLLDKHEVLRPGYTRLSIPYWMENLEDYVVHAISIICEHGWKFLPYYK